MSSNRSMSFTLDGVLQVKSPSQSITGMPWVKEAPRSISTIVIESLRRSSPSKIGMSGNSDGSRCKPAVMADLRSFPVAFHTSSSCTLLTCCARTSIVHARNVARVNCLRPVWLSSHVSIWPQSTSDFMTISSPEGDASFQACTIATMAAS
jgi:hypothetical protein